MPEPTPEQLLAAALDYAASGVAVFPVRVVKVSTPSGDRKKVWPVGRWRQASTTDPDQIRAWWDVGQPLAGWSVAIDCGKSGIVVVDGDGAAGMAELARLAEAGMSIGNGVDTPGGGQHWYYRADPDHPVSIDSSAKVAPGVDVRGDGGFVIAPPSSDWRGAYRWLDEPVHWDGLEPVPTIIIERMGAQKKVPELQLSDFVPIVSGVGETIGTDEPAPFGTPGRQFTMAEAVAYGQPYLDRLRDAPVGTINSRLNDAAKVLSHFIGPFWTADQVRDILLKRLESTAYDGATWSADDTIGSAFRSAAGDWRAVLVDDPFATGGTDQSAPPEQSLVEALEAEFLTADQVTERPPPVPLVLDYLDLDSLAWLIGKPGSYKSFLALDWAGHIGQGTPWRGHPVHQGDVMYIVAEGVTGMSLRVRAWQERHGRMKAVRFLPRPVLASTHEWAVLVELARRAKPAMVVLDTQARVTAGMEENSNTDMGVFIQRAEELRAASGACVLVVHHIGRNSEDARGASALDGAQSTEIKIKRSERGALWAMIEQDKQKDMAEAEPIEVQLDSIDLGLDPASGRRLSSLVLAPVDPFGTPLTKPRDWVDNLAENEAELAGVMREHFPLNGATKAELKRVVQERRRDRKAKVMPDGSFAAAWDVLVTAVGEVSDGKRGRPGKGVFVRIAGTQRYMIGDET